MFLEVDQTDSIDIVSASMLIFNPVIFLKVCWIVILISINSETPGGSLIS